MFFQFLLPLFFLNNSIFSCIVSLLLSSHIISGEEMTRDGRSRLLGSKGVTSNIRDGTENTRKFVRSNSVPNHNTCQGLETPGGYSLSQNDVGGRSSEFRTPQSTRCGTKIAGMGGRDWGMSEPADVSALLNLDSAVKFNAGEWILFYCGGVYLWISKECH